MRTLSILKSKWIIIALVIIIFILFYPLNQPSQVTLKAAYIPTQDLAGNHYMRLQVYIDDQLLINEIHFSASPSKEISLPPGIHRLKINITEIDGVYSLKIWINNKQLFNKQITSPSYYEVTFFYSGKDGIIPILVGT